MAPPHKGSHRHPLASQTERSAFCSGPSRPSSCGLITNNCGTTSSPAPGHSNPDLSPHPSSWKASTGGPGPGPSGGLERGHGGAASWPQLACLSLRALGPVPRHWEWACLGFLPTWRLQDRQTASVAVHGPGPVLGWAGWRPWKPHRITSALLYWTTCHKAHSM